MDGLFAVNAQSAKHATCPALVQKCRKQGHLRILMILHRFRRFQNFWMRIVRWSPAGHTHPQNRINLGWTGPDRCTRVSPRPRNHLSIATCLESLEQRNSCRNHADSNRIRCFRFVSCHSMRFRTNRHYSVLKRTFLHFLLETCTFGLISASSDQICTFHRQMAFFCKLLHNLAEPGGT